MVRYPIATGGISISNSGIRTYCFRGIPEDELYSTKNRFGIRGLTERCLDVLVL